MDSRSFWKRFATGSLPAKEWPAAFFRMTNTYLFIGFIGDYKYWLMTHWDEMEAEGNYVINRARLYRDRRDFVIQPGDTGKREDYPRNPAYLRLKETFMPDSDTLLAYLVSSFPGNTENIATEALRHIFDHSDASVEALNDVVQSGIRGVNPISTVKSQVIQVDGTRPDLVGFDENGRERVLVEVKFWAELTDKQPNGYVKRLPDDGPAVVVFLVPEERIQSLWPQLRRRLNGNFDVLTEIDSERKCVRVGDTQRHLMIVGWGGLLDSMAARSRDYDESGVESEIRQLRSLAKYADAGALKPIRQGEEFGADSEVRQRQYKRLIDAATQRGIEQEWASRKGLRATPRTYGYGRYISIRDAIVWFGVNVDQFERTGDTPLWVDCGIYLLDKPGEVRDQLGMDDASWAPVNLKRDVEYPEMLDSVVDSLKHIADVIYEARFPSR